jgi:anaerobic ribonucleoside-triphosphate reductase activating protein
VDCEWTLIEDLEHRILATRGLEGLTVTGCEPFVQACALGVLAQRVRRAGMSVMTYSGYTLEELLSGVVLDAMWLLYSADLLLDGRYRRDLPTAKPWRGSDNQRLIALSSRYASQVEAWNQPLGQDFEIRMQADGTLEVLGIPPAGLKDGSSGMESGARQQPCRRNTREEDSR